MLDFYRDRPQDPINLVEIGWPVVKLGERGRSSRGICIPKEISLLLERPVMECPIYRSSFSVHQDTFSMNWREMFMMLSVFRFCSLFRYLVLAMKNSGEMVRNARLKSFGVPVEAEQTCPSMFFVACDCIVRSLRKPESGRHLI